MQPHVHHARLRRAFPVQFVELVDQDVAELVGRVAAPGEDREVVDFIGVRGGNDVAVRGPDQIRLIVVHEVAVEQQPGLGQDPRRGLRAAQRRRQPAARLAPHRALVDVQRALDHLALALLVAGKVRQQLALLVVVRDQLAAALHGGLDHRQAPLAGHGIERAARRDAQLVEQFELPPDAHPLAVFAPGVVREIRHPARKRVGQDGRPARVIRRVGVLGQVPGFEIERDQQRNALAVRPLEPRPLRDRRVVVFHLGTSARRAASRSRRPCPRSRSPAARASRCRC